MFNYIDPYPIECTRIEALPELFCSTRLLLKEKLLNIKDSLIPDVVVSNYCYLLLSESSGKFYFGARSSECYPHEDLGTIYFSSSSRISSKNFSEFTPVILSTRKTRKEALRDESNLISEYRNTENCLNLQPGISLHLLI